MIIYVFSCSNVYASIFEDVCVCVHGMCMHVCVCVCVMGVYDVI